MTETVTFKGKPLQLLSHPPKEGKVFPDCELINAELKPVKLSSFKGKVLLLLSVPSLDTSVCSKEAHQFNEDVQRFENQISSILVSMDLPFAQQRWCNAENARNLTMLSDFNKHDFAKKSGLLITDLGLLARAVFICDPSLKIQHAHIVKEVTEEPDYKKILNQLVDVISSVDSRS